MNRLKVAIASFAIAALAAVPLAVIGQAPAATDRPSVVPEGAWIPLTADLGFVQTGQQMTTYGSAPDLARSVNGFFMVRKDGRWHRVDIAATAQLWPAL